jgi:DNA primase
LVAQVRGQGFADAVAWLDGASVAPGTVTKPAPAVVGSDRSAVLRELLDACGTPSAEAQAYWQRRGLSDAVVAEFGLTDAKPGTAAALESHGSLEQLVEVGVLSQSGRLRFEDHPLLFPFWQDGAPVYLQARRYGSAEPRYLGVRGPIPCLYNVAALSADEVWVAEGCIDTLTLASAGVAAVGIVGARGLKAAWLPAFADKTVVLALDNDAAGRVAATQLLPRLGPIARMVCVAVLPEGADVNTYVVATGCLPTREAWSFT